MREVVRAETPAGMDNTGPPVEAILSFFQKEESAFSVLSLIGHKAW